MSKGTYIALKIAEESKNTIRFLNDELGLENTIPLDDLHVTLLYAEKDLLTDYIPDEELYVKATITGMDVLGVGEWQAIVLKLSSDKLTEKHNDIISKYGKIHSYDDYNIHMSLKYKPTDSDKSSLYIRCEDYLDRDWCGKEIILTNEYIESLED